VAYSRVSNKDYVEDGLSYLIYRKSQVSDKNIKTNPVRGVKGLWPFAHLPYIDVSKMICWDPFHVVSNISKYILALLKGDRANKSNVANHCLLQGCHPSIHGLSNDDSKEDNSDSNKQRKVSKTTCPIWVLSNRDQKQAEEYINCILVPTGSKQNMEVCSPFTRTGQLKGVGHMQLLTTYMDYVLSATKLAVPYKRFLSMLSYDIALLVQLIVQDSELETISKQIIELLCIKEGLFPDSEGTFTWHTLIDIPLHIRQFGPVKGWWTLYGERAMSVLKEFVPQGGASFHKTALDRYIKYEVSTMNKVYSSAEEIFETAGEGHLMYGVHTTYFVSNNFPYIYKRRVAAKTKRGEDVLRTLTTFDLYYIVEMMFIEVQKVSKTFAAAIKNSPLYYCARFYFHFIFIKEVRSGTDGRHNKSSFISSFIKWCAVDKGDALLNWKEMNGRYLLRVGLYRTHEEKDILNSFVNGLIYDECIEAAEGLKNIQIKMFKYATVADKNLRSRDWNCRENCQPLVDKGYGREQRHIFYLPANSNDNNIKTCWYKQEQYSSWCAIQTDELIIGDLSDKWRSEDFDQLFVRDTVKRERKLFAQINAFMMIKLKHELMFTAYPMVSVTCRYYELVNNTYRVNAEDRESYVDNRHFVPLYHILPTQVASVGFIESNDASLVDKPIYLGNEPTDSAEGSEVYRHHYTERENIDYLVLIPMEPLVGTKIASSLPQQRGVTGAAKYPMLIDDKRNDQWLTMHIINNASA
jgi:hypothetical protein